MERKTRKQGHSWEFSTTGGAGSDYIANNLILEVPLEKEIRLFNFTSQLIKAKVDVLLAYTGH